MVTKWVKHRKVFKDCKNCGRPYRKDKHENPESKLCPSCYRFEMDLISEEIMLLPKEEDFALLRENE